MKKVLDVCKELIILSFATLIIAASVFFFLIPSKASVSSISGLAIVLANFIPLSISVITFILNVVLLIIGYFTIGKEFSYKTVYTSILLPVYLYIFEVLFPNNQSLTGYNFLDVFYYVFFVSMGLMILFTRNASSGGIDIVAKILNKYLNVDLGKAMSVSGMVVALSSMFAYSVDVVLLSIVGTYLNGVILDSFIFDRDMKRKVCIITKKENELEEIRKFILYELHSGASFCNVTGAYTLDNHLELDVIVDKNEYQKLMAYISKYESMFVTVYKLSSMKYNKKPIVYYEEDKYKNLDTLSTK